MNCTCLKIEDGTKFACSVYFFNGQRRGGVYSRAAFIRGRHLIE